MQKKKKSFADKDAVVELGVGKNMVSSIRYWMKAFNLLTQDDELTLFAHKLFADDGYDPYLEDEASLWLLHYQLSQERLMPLLIQLYLMNFEKKKLSSQRRTL